MNAVVSYCDFPNGEIQLVSSKSISNRALIIHALTGFQCKLNNLSASNDTKVLNDLIHELHNQNSPLTLNVGLAGTTMRFLTTFAAISGKEVVLTGTGRMLERPIGDLVNALIQLGAKISWLGKPNCPPIRIEPSLLKGGRVELNAGISSQFVSSLLLCAPYFENGINLELKGNIVSSSYIRMTVEIMKAFGIHVDINHTNLTVSPGKYLPKEFTIEGDWSSASYFYSLAILSKQANILVPHLRMDSLQGDKAIAQIAAELGVVTKSYDKGIRIVKQDGLHIPEEFQYDFSNCPDIAQTVAVMLSALRIKSCTFTGLSTLRNKETDRIEAIVNELKKFNVEFLEVTDERISFNAGNFLAKEQTIATYHDHRMAMSFVPLAQLCGKITIENAEVVRKSYINFWNDLISLGSVVKNTDI